jgi:hypothetical protein
MTDFRSKLRKVQDESKTAFVPVRKVSKNDWIMSKRHKPNRII